MKFTYIYALYMHVPLFIPIGKEKWVELFTYDENHPLLWFFATAAWFMSEIVFAINNNNTVYFYVLFHCAQP